MRTGRVGVRACRAAVGRRAGRTRGAGIIAAALLPAACGEGPSILQPKGPAAAPITELWWILFGSTGIVTLIVFGLFAAALVRGRRGGDGEARVPGGATRFVVVGGAVVPALILVGLVWSTLDVGRDVARAGDAEATLIDVIGHQFWWEVHYPDAGAITANEIHVPAGRPVRIRLSSVDVIHSFWAPSLAGKLDLVPGTTNELRLQVDSPGVYLGHCAEFCGIQHAKMLFLVIAQTPREFEQWLERQRRPAAAPTHPTLLRGLQVFIEAECVNCHAIRGIADLPETLGTPGPDLTHVGSRRTLAAVTVPNVPEWLAAWILAPHEIKRGNRMPASRLDPESLTALVAYLESLK